MNRRRFFTWTSLGLLLGLPWLALAAAGQQIARLPLPPVALFELLTRRLPGALITQVIDLMIALLRALRLGPTARLAKLAEFGLAYLLAGVLLGLLAGLGGIVLDRLRLNWQAKGLLLGLVLGLAAASLATWEGGGLPGVLWLLALSLGWGLALAWGAARFVSLQSGIEALPAALNGRTDGGRRRTLAFLAFGALGLAGAALGLGRRLSRRPNLTTAGVAGSAATAPPTAPAFPEASTASAPTSQAAATSPAPTSDAGVTATAPANAAQPPPVAARTEITPLADFYRVDINLLPPGMEDFARETDPLAQRLRAQGGDVSMDAESYYLTITGLVQTPLAFTLAEVQSFPAVDQYATLSCISNPVGGDLISTNVFTGARLGALLAPAGLLPEASELKFTCVDGYTESLPLAVAQDPRTLLCYALGRQPLTQDHGAPLRLYVPDRFGMKNPKWLVKIEVLAEDFLGYWEQRGWNEEAYVQTTAVIDALSSEAEAASGRRQVQAAGIAFAGARGITRVEVRLDEEDWLPMELKPPLSALAWVLWHGAFTASPGLHQLAVRAADSTGEFQTETSSGAHPTGATGYHIRSFKV